VGVRRRRIRHLAPARIYDLRSTFASDALAAGIPVFTLAKIMGTSVAMIERHYAPCSTGPCLASPASSTPSTSDANVTELPTPTTGATDDDDCCRDIV
jgi:hypothetical protein